MHFINRRVQAMGLHFLLSVSVASLMALVIFQVWYPPPYSDIAGGWTLFAILVAIDVIIGPFLTAVVASPTKPRTHLQFDITFIVVLQLLAFAYGVSTIARARPVYLVFEVDRFRVVSAADVDAASLEKASLKYRNLPWTGPTLISARKSVTSEEMLQSLDLALQGVDLAMQPNRWTDYEKSVSSVLQIARPAPILIEKYPELNDLIHNIAKDNLISLDSIRFLPMVSRQASWVALVAEPDARIVGYISKDGFF